MEEGLGSCGSVAAGGRRSAAEAQGYRAALYPYLGLMKRVAGPVGIPRSLGPLFDLNERLPVPSANRRYWRVVSLVKEEAERMSECW